MRQPRVPISCSTHQNTLTDVFPTYIILHGGRLRPPHPPFLGGCAPQTPCCKKLKVTTSTYLSRIIKHTMDHLQHHVARSAYQNPLHSLAPPYFLVKVKCCRPSTYAAVLLIQNKFVPDTHVKQISCFSSILVEKFQQAKVTVLTTCHNGYRILTACLAQNGEPST